MSDTKKTKARKTDPKDQAAASRRGRASDATASRRGRASARAEEKKKPSSREKAEKGRSFPVWIFILLGTILLLAFAIWSYYPVAKQQYIASREKEKLQAELAIIEKRNKELQDEIDRLNTDEGIEDYARNELGWVKKGENSVIVEGLDSGAKSSTGVDWRVNTEDIKLKHTPWTRFMDMIFGIESE